MPVVKKLRLPLLPDATLRLDIFLVVVPMDKSIVEIKKVLRQFQFGLTYFSSPKYISFSLLIIFFFFFLAIINIRLILLKESLYLLLIRLCPFGFYHQDLRIAFYRKFLSLNFLLFYAYLRLKSLPLVLQYPLTLLYNKI